MPHRIAVFDTRLLQAVQKQIQGLSDDHITFPKERCPSEQELIARTGNADIVLVGPSDRITMSYLNACPGVRYVGLCGTSTANIDLEGLAKRHITFTNVVSHSKEPVAEFVFMQLVRLARGVGDYQWKAEQHELMGKPIGIIGLGAVGQAIAHMALAYKMNAAYYSPHRKHDWEKRSVQYLDMAELVASNEIIVICSPTNVQVLGKKEFSLLRPNSIIVQASGGNPFDKPAFLHWIAQDGNYAILDKSAGAENYHAYKDLPRVVFSEAVAGDTYEANERRGRKIVANLKAYLQTHDT